ncbi:unnamed protein product, partial [Pleuronectes platessa]
MAELLRGGEGASSSAAGSALGSASECGEGLSFASRPPPPPHPDCRSVLRAVAPDAVRAAAAPQLMGDLRRAALSACSLVLQCGAASDREHSKHSMNKAREGERERERERGEEEACCREKTDSPPTKASGTRVFLFSIISDHVSSLPIITSSENTTWPRAKILRRAEHTDAAVQFEVSAELVSSGRSWSSGLWFVAT